LTLSNAQLPAFANTLYYAQAVDAAGNAGPVSALFMRPNAIPSVFRNGFEG